MKSLHLKPGREKPLLRRHPWIFSGSIAHLKGDPVSGETVEVYDSGGNFLARAAYSPKSQIRGRVWTWDRGQQVDRDFIHALIKKAIAYRETIQKLNAVNNNAPHLAESKSIDQKSKALRLIHAESDGLPGLIVDAYNDILISQALSAGVEHWLDDIVEILVEVSQAKCICERSDVDVRKLEGLPSRIRILKGAEPPKRLIIDESGLRFYVDWQFGHKTGFYIDQRTNRRIIRKYTRGQDVLDCFSYTGGFTLNALAGGAKSVVAVDSSAQFLEILNENVQLNGFESSQVSCVKGDVFQVLRKFLDRGRSFDLIILDPPKFAPTSSQVHKAARGYKDINLNAFKLLRPGGLLVTFSCSSGVSPELFQKILAGAALDARVNARIIQRLSQSWDHPIALNFPEGGYLKGLVIQI
jgi:23S rRNA (cytosine1962-C5)-methyltransferase